MPVSVDHQQARQILSDTWKKIMTTEAKDFLEDKELLSSVVRSIGSSTGSYRYAALTQVLAKAVNPSVDSRCLQKKAAVPGAFDARSLCKKVIVDFDRKNDSVLGGSGDPYVSKPLRHKEISHRYRNEIKDKRGWDALSFVLEKVEEKDDPKFTAKILLQVLLEVKRRLVKIAVVYPTPRRVSLTQVENLITEYLSTPSEGVRLEVVTASLFKTIGEMLGCYGRVDVSKTTAANYFIKRIADIECYDLRKTLVKAIDAKDREVTKADIEEKLPKIRGGGTSELVFVTTKGTRRDDEAAIKTLVDKEFQSGRNIYIVSHIELSRAILILLGEEGRRKFVENISMILEEGKYPYEHRKEWAELLARL